MRNAECGIAPSPYQLSDDQRAIKTPSSEHSIYIPHSAFRIPHSFKRYGINRRFGADFLRPFGDDSFIRLQSVFDHPHRPDAGADLDGSNVYFVVIAHDGDSVTALQLGDRALRDEQRALLHAGYRADFGRSEERRVG